MDQDSNQFDVRQAKAIITAAMNPHPPLFRNEPDEHGKPLVYGYIRSARGSRRVVETCRIELASFCEREQFSLSGVFVDQGIDDNVLVRPGLAGLCDVLSLPDSYGAVLVDPTHLSWRLDTARFLARRIVATGVKLLTASDAPPSKTAAWAQAQWLGRSR